MIGGAYFVTGTDTGVGKTVVATGLLEAARRRGLETVGLKPLAAGIDGERDGVEFNADALALQDTSTVRLDYHDINPVLLRRAIAPHIAAAEQGARLGVDELAAHCRRVLDAGCDFAVLEGAGGWLVPLDESRTLADLCVALGLPVVLVVGMKLGCLNHALLTAQAVGNAGLTLAGWVANTIDAGMEAADANVAALRDRLPAPLLGRVPRLAAAEVLGDAAADYLDLDRLRDA